MIKSTSIASVLALALAAFLVAPQALAAGGEVHLEPANLSRTTRHRCDAGRVIS